jgi:hypothetical protein
MPHSVADQVALYAPSPDREPAGRRLIRIVGEWSFIVLTWMTMIGLFLYPTLHVIGLFAFSVWALVTRNRPARRCRDPW